MKKKTLLTILLLAIVQAVAFGQADSCFTLLIRPTLLGAPYYDILPITVTNQTQGTSFTMNDSLLQNCNPTGVEDFDARGFTLSASYPNPSEGKANVTLTTGRDGNVALQLFDVQGRLKASSTVALERGTHTVEVSLSGRGLHILRATSYGQNVYTKIVNLASSRGGDAVRVGASISAARDSKGVLTQQNVQLGDKLAIRHSQSPLVYYVDSAQNGLFIFDALDYVYYHLLRDNDTLCWSPNSLKNKTIIIPLPYRNAFLTDHNVKHLIWKYLFFEDSTFTVVTNPECALVDIPQYIHEQHFANGYILYGTAENNLFVWPIVDGQYKYTLSPYMVDSNLVEGSLDIYNAETGESGIYDKPCHRGEFQLNIYTMGNVFVMQRFLKPRTKVFPKAFIMQKGHMDPDDWFDTPPPTIGLYFLDDNESDF